MNHSEAVEGLEGDQSARWAELFAKEAASHIAGEGKRGGAQSKTKHLLVKKN